MSYCDLAKILTENGFNCKEDLDGTHIVENLQIIHCEPLVEYIDVEYEHYNQMKKFKIFINFKNAVVREPNWGLNIDVKDYIICDYKFIMKIFDSENDFIDELQRLDSIGLDIKG